MVRRGGVGPEPCPIANLTVQKLSEALKMLLEPEMKARVTALAEQMNKENGVEVAVKSFKDNLPLGDMLCEVDLFRKKCSLAKVYCCECALKMSLKSGAVIRFALTPTIRPVVFQPLQIS
jgi:hypothetical protein